MLKKALTLFAITLIVSILPLFAASPCDSKPTTAKKYHCYRFVEVEDCTNKYFVLDMEQIAYVVSDRTNNQKWFVPKSGAKQPYCDKIGDLLSAYRLFLQSHPEYLR